VAYLSHSCTQHTHLSSRVTHLLPTRETRHEGGPEVKELPERTQQTQSFPKTMVYAGYLIPLDTKERPGTLYIYNIYNPAPIRLLPVKSEDREYGRFVLYNCPLFVRRDCSRHWTIKLRKAIIFNSPLPFDSFYSK